MGIAKRSLAFAGETPNSSRRGLYYTVPAPTVFAQPVGNPSNGKPLLIWSPISLGDEVLPSLTQAWAGINCAPLALDDSTSIGMNSSRMLECGKVIGASNRGFGATIALNVCGGRYIMWLPADSSRDQDRAVFLRGRGVLSQIPQSKA